MMRKFMILAVAVALFTACSDDDDPVVVKDYGMQTFSADMKYKSTGGMATDFTSKQQTYMKLGQKDAVATGEYKTDSWTTFNILPKVPDGEGNLIDNKDYNVTTSVKGWDLLFTQYVGDAYFGKGPNGKILPYFLGGVLINTSSVTVGLYIYEDSKEAEDINKAFSDLTLANVANITYDNTIDVIGTKWRKMSGMPPSFTPNTNYFYIVKTTAGDYYKLRFTGYYGATKAEKVFTCEYALMK